MLYRASWLESSFVEKDLGNLAENKSSRSEKCALMIKQVKKSPAVIRSVASKWREVILPQYSSVSSAGLFSIREKWSYWTGEGQGKGYRAG